MAEVKRLLARETAFTAICATNLQVEVGAGWGGLREHGVRVPVDVSIVGFHDAPLAQVVTAALTVVKLPLYATGYQATQGILGLIDGSATIVPKVLLAIGSICCDSTAPPKLGVEP